jgi:uncharacterized protein YndB with AHSA1/START domain
MDLFRRLSAPSVTEATLPASADVVYEVLADPETYPRWLVGADHMRAVDADFPEPGSRFHHTVGAGPVKVDDATEALDADEGRRIVLRVHVGPFQADVEFLLIPQGAEETLVRFTERAVGLFGPVNPLLRPTLHARNALSLRRLRDVVAGDTLAA